MPLFHDFLQIFKNKTIDMLVVAACLARNGFEIGCCSDEIIEVRTNLSPDSIQQSFKRLTREGIFLREIRTKYKKRHGKIKIDDFKNKYSYLCSPHSCVDNFRGIVTKIETQESRIFLEGEKKQQYVVFSQDSESVIFCLSIGVKITFEGSVLDNSTEPIAIWLNDNSIKRAMN
jgi:hypothetical protein